jgi:hypothetical protein
MSVNDEMKIVPAMKKAGLSWSELANLVAAITPVADKVDKIADWWNDNDLMHGRSSPLKEKWPTEEEWPEGIEDCNLFYELSCELANVLDEIRQIKEHWKVKKGE